MDQNPDQNREQDRAEYLRRDGMLIGIAGLSLLNGMHFSPFFDPAVILLRPFTPAFLISSPILLFYFTSLMLATTTLILGGVPAALFERATGRQASDFASLGVWLAACALLALPTIMRMGGLG